jgi:arylsulfatase
MIVHWPDGLQDKNKLRHNPCHFVDILPTIVDLAGGDAAKITPAGSPPPAGRTLAPAFRKDGAAPHDYIYFNHNNNHALRQGDWKLISTGAGGPWELYDMSKDRCEQNNLAGKQPDRVKKMAALWKERDDEFERTRESAPPLGRKLQDRRG